MPVFRLKVRNCWTLARSASPESALDGNHGTAINIRLAARGGVKTQSPAKPLQPHFLSAQLGVSFCPVGVAFTLIGSLFCAFSRILPLYTASKSVVYNPPRFYLPLDDKAAAWHSDPIEARNQRRACIHRFARECGRFILR